MGHPWMKQIVDKKKRESQVGVSAAFAQLRQFNSESNLKKAAYSFISQQLLSKKDKDDYLQIFNALDEDHNGSLTRDEFINGSNQFFGESMSEEMILDLYNQADLNNDGTIQYSEFVLAVMKQEELLSEKKLRTAF